MSDLSIRCCSCASDPDDIDVRIDDLDRPGDTNILCPETSFSRKVTSFSRKVTSGRGFDLRSVGSREVFLDLDPEIEDPDTSEVENAPPGVLGAGRFLPIWTLPIEVSWTRQARSFHDLTQQSRPSRTISRSSSRHFVSPCSLQLRRICLRHDYIPKGKIIPDG